MLNLKKVNKDKLRIAFEMFFLLIFILLFRANVMQRWVLFFALGLVTSILLGRFYCGWACPISALMRPINWVYKKLNFNRLKTPEFIKKGWFRWILLLLFLVFMVGSKIFNIKFNLILYLTFFGVLVSLLFEEELFHKNICPYGTLFSQFTKPAKFSMKILEDKCISCGRCEQVCPNNSISILANNKRTINNGGCLLCFKCQGACSVAAITYGKI